MRNDVVVGDIGPEHVVAFDNLMDLIVTCIDHSAAANQVFLSGDGKDLSTTELLQLVARSMGKSAQLLFVPISMDEGRERAVVPLLRRQ